ncbi:MAG: cell division protein FtsL [Gammaproteobacteria bacterium]
MTVHPLALLILVLAVITSSIGVVYAKHQSRKLFIELQSLANDRDNMDIEWGQLQLEQSTLTTQGQVESAARESLGMVNLSHANTVIVKP